MEEDGIVEGLGETSWAGAVADRHEYTTKIEMISRKIIRFRPASEPVGSDALHALVQGVGTEHKRFSGV